MVNVGKQKRYLMRNVLSSRSPGAYFLIGAFTKSQLLRKVPFLPENLTMFLVVRKGRAETTFFVSLR